LMKNRVNVKRFKNEIVSDDFSLAALPASIRKNMCLGCA
jgi:hypothetical protein